MSAWRAGVVGTGRMGGALTRRLLHQGVGVAVWDRTPSTTAPLVALGATAVPELGMAWDGTDAVMASLADDAALRAVCLGPAGLLAGAPRDALFIDTSTVSPTASLAVAEAAAERGVQYLRCPFSGNPATVVSGRASFIVSGPPSVLERARELLGLVCPVLTWVGEGEQARVMKLAVNMMAAVTTEMLAEVVALSEAYGIERKVALEAVGNSVVSSRFVEYKAPALLARRYDATFTTAMMLKDMDLSHGAAAEVGVGLPATDLVRGLLSDACSAGLGEADFLALLPLLQAAAGRPTDLPVARPPDWPLS